MRLRARGILSESEQESYYPLNNAPSPPPAPPEQKDRLCYLEVARKILPQKNTGLTSVGPDAVNRSVALTLCFRVAVAARNGDRLTLSVTGLTKHAFNGPLRVHQPLCRGPVRGVATETEN